MKIIDIIENNDESATVEVEVTEEEKDKIKKHYGKKRFTQKLLERAVQEGIKNYCDKTVNKDSGKETK